MDGGDSSSPPGGGSVTLGMTDLNQNFVCVLCFGYFIDATTISDCLHTFCKSCIVNFLQSNHHCPHCDILLSRTSPLKSLRPDRVLQSLVYKTVPGLFQNEMQRRIQFYHKNPHPDRLIDLEGVQNYIFNPEDSISLSLRYYSYRNQESNPGSGSERLAPSATVDKAAPDVPDIHAIRYFRCPATVPVSVIKSLIKTKYRIPEFLRVELLYGEECLLDTWTLMEVAYIFQWNRESPMELTFQVLITRKVKRKRVRLVRKVRTTSSSSEDASAHSFQPNSNGPCESLKLEEPPTKKTKSDTSSFPLTSASSHLKPLTSPEIPDTNSDSSLEPQVPSKGRLSLKIKRGICLSPSDSSSNVNEIKIDYSIVSSVHDEPLRVDDKKSRKHSLSQKSPSRRENVNVSKSNCNALSILKTDLKSECSLDISDKKLSNITTEDEDFGEPCCDQDSESALEVDTSHETELELDIESDLNINTKVADENEDDEQADSAIECNELSASEIMDSDDKETDLNVSSESLDADSNKSFENTSTDIKVSSPDEISGALDFSSHARSVRAQRKSDDPPSSPQSSSSLESPVNVPTVPVAPSESSNSFNINDKLKELLPIEHSILSRAGMPVRPPLSLDWVRPPLVGTTGVPQQAAAYRDLVTLSHAVQFQIAMAHAQAQAHVQAQTQKFQNQVNVLQNLKTTESLSFVNGSGDTLTISPIVRPQGEPKPKTIKAPKSKLNGMISNSPKKTPLLNVPATKKVHNKTDSLLSKNKQINNFISNAIQVNSKQNLKSNLTKNNLNHKNTQNKLYKESPLKIPCVPVKQSSNKSDKERSRKDNTDKEVERTGDPVFQITNQKLIECFRQQHLNTKLKQNNNNNNTIKSLSNNSECMEAKTTQSNPVQPTSCSNSFSKLPSTSLATIKPTITSSSGYTSSAPVNKVISSVSKLSAPVNKVLKSVSKSSSPSSLKVPSTNALPNRKPSPLPNSTIPLIIPKDNSLIPKTTSINGTMSLPSTLSSHPTSHTTISSGNITSLPNGKSNPTFVSKTLMSSLSSSPSQSTLRTTNTHVRQIPNPSRLHQQSENRISAAGLGRVGGFLKKGLPSQSEGLSRIESLTRSLHEKVAASAALANGGSVLNSFAR